MSTHEHLIVTDTEGRLPQFLQEFHRLVALGVKALRNWQGAVWDQRKTSVVRLCTDNAVLEKIAYVIANPVMAGLVRRARDWPGVNTSPEDVGTARWKASRPPYFFSAANESWPEEVELELTVPPSVHIEGPELRSAIAREVHQLVSSAPVVPGSDTQSDDLSALRNSSPYARATSIEPAPTLNPAVAVGRAAGDALRQAIIALREFRLAYRIALDQWRLGVRETLFPAGTWLMQRLHGVNVCEL